MDHAMIMIYGILADLQIELMCARLNEMRVPYFFLDQLKIPNEIEIDIDCSVDGVTGVLTCDDGRRVDVGEISGIYARFVKFKNDPRRHNRVSNEFRDIINDEISAQFMALFDLIPCEVMNRPSASTSNDVKPYQKMIIESVGLCTPKTLITNDSQELVDFAEEQEKVVVKSTSGTRSQVRLLDTRDRSRFNRLRYCPIQVEQYVDGIDFRAHVVGDQVYVTEIGRDTKNVDYRYAQPHSSPSRFHTSDLPLEVRVACVELAQALSLPIAGIDLRMTSDGIPYCFEVNSSPAFSVYELQTGQEISKAVVEALQTYHSEQHCTANTG